MVVARSRLIRGLGLVLTACLVCHALSVSSVLSAEEAVFPGRFHPFWSVPRSDRPGGVKPSPPPKPRQLLPNYLQYFDPVETALNTDRFELDFHFHSPRSFKLELRKTRFVLAYRHEYTSGGLYYQVFGPDDIGSNNMVIFGRGIDQWDDFFKENLAYVGALYASGLERDVLSYLTEQGVFQLIEDLEQLAGDFQADFFHTVEEGDSSITAGSLRLHGTGEVRQIKEYALGDVRFVYVPLWFEAATNQSLRLRARIERYPAGTVARERAPFHLYDSLVEVHSGEQLRQHLALGCAASGWVAGVIYSAWESARRQYLLAINAHIEVDQYIRADSALLERTAAEEYTQLAAFTGPRLRGRWGELILALGGTRGQARQTSQSDLGSYGGTFHSGGGFEFRSQEVPEQRRRHAEDIYGATFRLGAFLGEEFVLGLPGGREMPLAWSFALAGATDTNQWSWGRFQLAAWSAARSGWRWGLGAAGGGEVPWKNTPLIDVTRGPEPIKHTTTGRLRAVTGWSRHGRLEWPWRFRAHPLLPHVEEWLDLSAFPPGVFFVQDWGQGELGTPAVVWGRGGLRWLLRTWYRHPREYRGGLHVHSRFFELYANIEENSRKHRDHRLQLGFSFRVRGDAFMGIIIKQFNSDDTSLQFTFAGTLPF
jgi:hypothetical protein